MRNIFNEGISQWAGSMYICLNPFEFAILAGKRRGKLVILEVDTEKALANQVKFYKANHGVWLADIVQPQYLKKFDKA
ncbi:RNA 2'-phosphotransferase [Paenibacillus sp. TY11]|uniref:RNA 2'-phosphotransferase n=1 Tax=Paenibacillus sp. TY11 TaxID=3448633 RepID=UPI004039F885